MVGGVTRNSWSLPVCRIELLDARRTPWALFLPLPVSCSTEDMRLLPVASLLMCICLAERSHCNSSFQDSMRELHNRFVISLYQRLTETENSSNLILSPASVSLSLGLLQLGARGNTRSQLEGTLGYSVNDAQVQDFLLRPQGVVNNSSQGVWLQQTCTLFIQSGVQLLAEFAQHAGAWADTSVVRANFSRPSPARSQAERAGPKHEESWPLQSGSSSGELSGSGEPQAEALWWGNRLQVALVNTVAFRGVWQKQFLFSNTQNLPFILSDGSTIKVPMMYQAAEVSFGQFRAASEQRYTVLELPYLGRSLNLQVVLPSDRKTPLSVLESQLTARHLAAWATGLRRTKMDIFLPRFRMQNRFNLRSVLLAMGVSDAFNPTAADFTGISVEEGLYVSDAFHEVKIEVTEDGTKAAAATGSILFMGRVLNPADPGI
ncbi:probable serpin E3 isoform X2 [Kryptolebias marmoratus]|uniref:probable serpin E3 isoform X2 n=1 Tax=Kryptolebias marmoratus TaxID=37003 RepID=UPI000D52F48D|nr:probable serpin E3 isoform X2 [Kryptolebias marmoratus]